VTALASQPPLPAAPVPDARQRFTFENVSWAFYEHTLEELGNSRVRVTFDRGRMEIMSPLPTHDYEKKVAARLLEFYALEIDLPITSYGSTTLKSESLQRGLEPDECYYVYTHAPKPTKVHFDLAVTPLPDLAIEVDVTSSSVPRQPVYAALGVPEIWRIRGGRVTPLLRTLTGEYDASPTSKAFPRLDMNQFNHFLQIALTQDQHTALKAFRVWIRSTHQQ
jgi:Uma2 family endonuclease